MQNEKLKHFLQTFKNYNKGSILAFKIDFVRNWSFFCLVFPSLSSPRFLKGGLGINIENLDFLFFEIFGVIYQSGNCKNSEIRTDICSNITYIFGEMY